MKPMELPGTAAVVPGLAQHGAIVSPESPYDVVLAVGYQQKLLVLVGRKRELPYRTDPQCFRAQSELLNELPLLGEHLHPVIDTIADIHKAISRDVNATALDCEIADRVVRQDCTPQGRYHLEGCHTLPIAS
jgi:hypothetical protein